MLKKIIAFFFKKNFAGKHSKIISSFAKAAEEAKQLEQHMLNHIKDKEAHIAKIAQEIEEVNAVKAQTVKFSQNLSKLIGHEEIIVDSPAIDSDVVS